MPMLMVPVVLMLLPHAAFLRDNGSCIQVANLSIGMGMLEWRLMSDWEQERCTSIGCVLENYPLRGSQARIVAVVIVALVHQHGPAVRHQWHWHTVASVEPSV